MYKTSKALSYRKQIEMHDIVCGTLWLAAGILGFFDHLIIIVFRIIALAIAVAGLLWLLLKKNKQHADEMAETNLASACEITLDRMSILFCFVSLVFSYLPESCLPEISLNKLLPNLMFILMGLTDLLRGIIFARLEDE